jgi:hypothetical protein
MTCRTALAIYLGCGLLAAWAILRAYDHLRGRPPVTPPWEEPLPPVDPYIATILPGSRTIVMDSDNLTSADGGPVSIRWRQ